MSIEMNAMMRTFLNDAYSIFTQRDLWLFVDPRPASAVAALDRVPMGQDAPLSVALDQPQVKSPQDLLSVLRPPAPLITDAATRPDLWTALKTLSASTALIGSQSSQSNNTQASWQYAAKERQLYATNRQAPGSNVRQAIHATTLLEAKVNARQPVERPLRETAVSDVMPVDLPAADEKADYRDQQLLLMMRTRTVLIEMLVQLVVNSDSSSQAEGEFELPVILNAGMIPGATPAKAPPRLLGAAPMSNEQMLATLLQLGVDPTLMDKLKRILAKIKGSKKLAKSFLSVFIALFIVAERLCEELFLFMEEEEEIKEKLAYADSYGLADDRRRVYI